MCVTCRISIEADAYRCLVDQRKACSCQFCYAKWRSELVIIATIFSLNLCSIVVRKDNIHALQV